MKAHTIHRHPSIRTFLLAIALLLASAFATGTASASTLAPAVDIGAPGGGGITAAAQPEDLSVSIIPGIRTF